MSQLSVAILGVVGTLAGAVIGALIARCVAKAVAKQQELLVIRERQQQRLRDLQDRFFCGSLHLSRLKAEKLFLHEPERIQGKNFDDLFRELPLDEYADISSVLNFFRLLNAYKECGYIDEREAVEEFGWCYDWWWANVIEPHKLNPGHPAFKDWEPHLRCHDWLLGARRSTSK